RTRTTFASSATRSIVVSIAIAAPAQNGSVWISPWKQSFRPPNNDYSLLMLADKEKRKRFLQRIRVPLGFALAIVLVLLAEPTPITLAIGSVFVLLGILIRAWAAGHIQKFEKLAVTGPYSFTRNPLYFGSFLLAAGFAIAAGVWWLAVIVGVLYLAIYYPVMRVEETDLRTRFGPEFEEFAA